jgi:hypothetical protein
VNNPDPLRTGYFRWRRRAAARSWCLTAGDHGPRGTSERTVTPEVPWRRTIPGLPQETPSGDGADLIDALLEDVKGVVAAGSFVPELLEFVPEPLGHFGVADERVGEPRPLAAR